MIVRGPFDLKWGDNVLTDVEELDVEFEIDEEELDTIQGRTLMLDGSYKVSATLTLLATDIPSLAAVLPQHFVPNGQQLSTGETVNHADGAIDVKPTCEDDYVFNNLDIIACGSQANIARIVNCRTKIDSIEFDNKIRKVMVKFVGEAAADEGTVQFFRQGTIAVVS